MSNKKSNESRRKLLKSIAAGSGAVVAGKTLPESWTKPVINSIVLPAHAETTQTCCAGVFCNFAFNELLLVGSAEVSADCTINMEGLSEGGPWSGTGTIAADGSFSFSVSFPEAEEVDSATVTGTVTADCLRIQGKVDITLEDKFLTDDFSGAVSDGISSMDECPSPPP